MIEPALDAASWLLLGAGGFFVFTGGLGLIRLPDVYSRMHAAGMTDTLGAALFIAGMSVQAVQAGLILVTVKLLMILVFILFTGPTATYALANAVLAGGVRPKGRDGKPCPTVEGAESPSKM